MSDLAICDTSLRNENGNQWQGTRTICILSALTQDMVGLEVWARMQWASVDVRVGQDGICSYTSCFLVIVRLEWESRTYMHENLPILGVCRYVLNRRSPTGVIQYARDECVGRVNQYPVGHLVPPVKSTGTNNLGTRIPEMLPPECSAERAS